MHRQVSEPPYQLPVCQYRVCHVSCIYVMYHVSMSCIGTLISPELNVQLGNNWLLGNIQTAGLTFVLHWPPLAAGHWV